MSVRVTLYVIVKAWFRECIIGFIRTCPVEVLKIEHEAEGQRPSALFQVPRPETSTNKSDNT